ncbi:hypothetical protein ADUPG1_005560, partial [Aduncisulcus paluster]
AGTAGKSTRKNRCSECGKLGHDVSKCWKLHPELRKKSVKKEEGEKKKPSKMRPLSEVRCFKCGQMGHYASNCPLKRQPKEEGSLKALVDEGIPTYEVTINNGRIVRALVDSG